MSLLEEVRDSLEAFRQALDPAYRDVVIRTERGEVSVSALLGQLERAADGAISNVGTQGGADAQVTRILAQTAAIDQRAEGDRWSPNRAHERAWEYLEERLAELASAYGVDLGSDPGSWKADRATDGAVAERATELGRQVRVLETQLRAEIARSKSIRPGAGDSALETLTQLSAAADAVSESTRKGVDAEARVEGLVRQLAEVNAFLERHGLTGALRSQWSTVVSSAGALEGDFHPSAEEGYEALSPQ